MLDSGTIRYYADNPRSVPSLNEHGESGREGQGVREHSSIVCEDLRVETRSAKAQALLQREADIALSASASSGNGAGHVFACETIPNGFNAGRSCVLSVRGNEASCWKEAIAAARTSRLESHRKTSTAYADIFSSSPRT